MSKKTLVDFNKPEETIALDFATVCHPAVVHAGSAIDDYYAHVDSLLARSIRPDAQDDHVLLGLLVIELVSAAEYYFRMVLASIPVICPLAKARTLRSMLPLGGVSYYDRTWLVLGLLENSSLSSKGEIRKLTNTIVGVDIQDASSLGVALSDFERVCQIRHAVAHARGCLWFKNVAELGLDFDSAQRVKLSALAFQALVAKTHNAIRGYNAFIGNKILESWLGHDVLSGVWSKDKKIFSAFHRVFCSTIDSTPDVTVRSAYAKIRAVVRHES